MNTRATTGAAGSLAVLVAAVSYVGATGQRPAAAPPKQPLSIEGALIDRYCVTCHNEKDHTAGLTLDTIDVDNVGDDVDTWERAVRKLRLRAMPPPASGKPRPDEAGYDALVSYLERRLDRVATWSPNPGRPKTFHRLNRAEYQNAVRDLLALDVDAASLLPVDDASHGFDNVNVGELSPTLLDRYVSTARKISRLAVGSPVRSPGAHTVVLPLDLTQNDHLDEALPFGTRGGTTFRYVFPQDADYVFQIRPTRDRDDHIEGITEPLQIELSLDGDRLRLFTLAARGRADEEGQARTYGGKEGELDAGLKGRFPVKAGPHTVAVTFLKRPSVLSEAARQPFLADYNGRNMAAVFSV